MALIIEIALGYLRSRRRQTVVSTLGVALGVGFFIGMASLMLGFQQYFIAKIIDVSPHVVMRDEYRTPPPQPVERAHAGALIDIAGLKPKSDVRGIRNGKAKAAEIARISGVAVAPALRGEVILRYGAKDVAATLVGIDPRRERKVTNLERDLYVGSLDDLYTVANGIILGDGLADKLGAGRNTTLTAVSPTGVVRKVKVVGLFATGITALDNVEAYVLLKKAQVMQDKPNTINQIRLRLKDVTRAEAIARQIERRYGYRTESWEETNRSVLNIFVIQRGVTFSTVGAIVVVAAFGIFNIISTVVLEKTRDIAILKSMGLTEGDIQRVFVVQGLLIGVAGGLIGWLIGYGLQELLAAIPLKIEEGGFIRTDAGFPVRRWFGFYLIGAACALVATVFAAWLPARRAARLDPVQIIRGAA